MDFLVIAFYLSLLTYYIGVLIYMLPLPFYGIKKWAPQLMSDSIFSAFLIFSYSFIQWLIKYLGGVLGADWDAYYSWVLNETNVLVSLIVTFKIIGAGLSMVGLQFIASSLISPLISSLVYVLLFILTFTALVTALKILAPSLLALGILLYSIPFRITRSSGAMLISLVIVFSIATPLLPQFIDTVTTSPVLKGVVSEYGLYLANITVYDSSGTPVPYFLYNIYVNHTLVARYLADENGVIDASDIEKGVPYTNHTAVVVLAGYSYRTRIDPSKHPKVNESYGLIEITLPNLFLIKPLRFTAVFGYSDLQVVEKGDSYIVFKVTVPSNATVVVVGLNTDALQVLLDSYVINPFESDEYVWGGVNFRANQYHIPPGQHLVIVIISGEGELKPEFDEIYYARDTLGLSIDNPLSLVIPVTTMIYQLLLGPVIYVSILFSASIGLARILGGTSSRIARVVVMGI